MKTRIAAIFLAAAMLTGLTACADTRHAMTINGIEIRAGEYIYAQLVAAQRAAEKFREDNPDTNTSGAGFDFYAQTIEGKSFTDWVNAEAVEILKKRTAISLMFDEMGLELTPDDHKEIRDSVDRFWESSEGMEESGLNHRNRGEFFERSGITKASFTRILTYNKQEDAVFEALFAAGGTEEVTEAELRAEFAREFARHRFIFIPLKNADNEFFEEEDMEMLRELAKGYTERLNAGGDFAEIDEEHREFMKEWLAELEEDDGHEHGEDCNHDDEHVHDEDCDHDDEHVHDEDCDHDHDEEEREITEYMQKRTGTEDSMLTQEQIDFVFAIEVNKAALLEEENFLVVFQRLDVSEREDWFEDVRDVLIFDLRGDEFEERVAAKAATLKVVLNDAAIKRYKPETVARRGLL